MPIPERLSVALSGRYRVERELGAGGMATVYLAEDLKHDRKVAIKVLKPELAAVLGAERFVVEIKTTAALQHPHILPLFDSGTADGFLFYVMPFIEGETIREKLSRETQFGVDEAVRIAREIADALDYAHRHGVIHRDIKPENILLHDGRAMVMDFGIALAVSAAAGGRMTETGLSLGTPHYMSPEQATAEKEITARSDVYSLASVCYEMLAGEPPHMGNSAQQIIMKIIAEPVQPVTKLRKSVPANVAAALTKALEKLPADRFESANAFAQALANPAFRDGVSGGTAAETVASFRDPWRLGLAAAALLATAAALWFGLHGRHPAGDASRFALATPAGQELLAPVGTRVAFAPDGRSFVYTGPGPSRTQLWLRRLGDLDATPVAGSEGATSPSFSPDGAEIAFLTLAPFALKIASIAGGASRTVVKTGVSGGGVAWAPDGFLYFDEGTGLARVRPDGTDLTTVMPLDSLKGETGLAWPSVLPDARHILVRIRHGDEPPSNYSIVAVGVRDGSRKELVHALVAKYGPAGHLLWVTADGALHAQRFDPGRLELRGSSVAVGSGAAIAGFGAADIALSPSGDLIYTIGAQRGSVADLVWVDRNGSKSRVDTTHDVGLADALALSPDGSSVAMEFSQPGSGLTARIWVKHLRGGGPTQLITSELSVCRNPVWTPDGRYLLYTSHGGEEVRRRRADGSGNSELVLREARGIAAMAISPDGRTLLLRTATNGSSHHDVLQFRFGVDTAAVSLPAISAFVDDPVISPDGRWLAYASNESGRLEVYVSPFPNVNAQKAQISAAGGAAPRWSRAGDELFFMNQAGDMTAAHVRATPTFVVTRTERLFGASAGFWSIGARPVYDVRADAHQFLMFDVGGAQKSGSTDNLVVVKNFAAELEARLPE